MRIFDCFTFYNELDLLEIRLQELYNIVDVFVIVEATTTFTNRPKELIFDKNQDRFAAYKDKIRHIKVELPKDANAWNNEAAQRNAIMLGTKDAADDDLILISDVDEIPRPIAVQYAASTEQTLYAFRMPLFNFKFNYMRLDPDRYNVWIMAARASAFKEITPDQLRGLRFGFFHEPYMHSNQGCEIIEHGGWHFGYLGDNAYLRDKAQSFSHTEVNTPEFLKQIDIDKSIAERKEWNRSAGAQYDIVDFDDYFPESCKAHKNFIMSGSGNKIVDLLPPYPYNK